MGRGKRNPSRATLDCREDDGFRFALPILQTFAPPLPSQGRELEPYSPSLSAAGASATGLPSASMMLTLPRSSARPDCSILSRSPTTPQVSAPEIGRAHV